MSVLFSLGRIAMKANIKAEKQKKPKVKIGDKFANAVLGEIIDTLINRYDKSEEKKTMSFKAYCIGLRDLSNKQVGKDASTYIDETDEYYQKILEEGENDNG